MRLYNPPNYYSKLMSEDYYLMSEDYNLMLQDYYLMSGVDNLMLVPDCLM